MLDFILQPRSTRVHLVLVLLITMLIAVADTIVPSSARAEALVVVNPGFEDISGESVVNEFTFGPLNGWDLYDPGAITGGGAGGVYFLGTLTPFESDPIGQPGVFVNFPDGAPEGQRLGIAFNFFGSGGGGEWGFEQVLVDTLQPNTAYTLQVDVGDIASGTAMSGQNFVLDGFPGYRVEMRAGGELVAADDNTLAATLADGEFMTSTVAFTTGSEPLPQSGVLSIRLVSLNTVDPDFPASDLEVDFDNVRLDASAAAVPVPALAAKSRGTLLVALLSAGSVLVLRRSRSRL